MFSNLLWGMDFLCRFYKGVLFGSLTKLHISTTNICNSKCKTCFIWKNKNRENELTTDEWRQFFENSPKSVCWLSLSGGEPTLRKDLADITLSATEAIPNIRLVSLNSNGLLPDRLIHFTEKVLSENKKIKLYVSLSVDGIGKDHDTIRGVPGNFDKILHLFEELNKISKRYSNRIQLTMESTVSNYNVKNIEQIKNYMYAYDISHLITIANTNAYYNNIGNQSVKVDNKNLTKILKKYLSQMKFSLKPFFLLKRAFVKCAINYSIHPNKHPLPCTAAKNSVYVSSEGIIYPCITWQEKLGTVRNKPLKKNLASSKSKQIRNIIKQEKCPGCWTPCEATQSIMKRPWKIFQ